MSSSSGTAAASASTSESSSSPATASSSSTTTFWFSGIVRGRGDFREGNDWPPIPVLVLLLFSTLFSHHLSLGDPITYSGIVPVKHMSQMLSISDFDAVGEGTTLKL